MMLSLILLDGFHACMKASMSGASVSPHICLMRKLGVFRIRTVNKHIEAMHHCLADERFLVLYCVAWY